MNKLFKRKKDISPREALYLAVKLIGNQVEVAKAFGVRQQTVSRWFHSNVGVPAAYVIPLEKMVNGKISRYELRPDLYPD